MRFNELETQFILKILRELNTTTSIDLLIEKLVKNEYIKGRLLHLLFTELSRGNFSIAKNETIVLDSLLKKIKFKATPR